MDLSPDTVLQNRYRIIRQLGQGGMGMVYLAFDASVEHVVAVKLNRNLSSQGTTQFIREARLLANLHHPNLPRVTDYFVIGDSQFLVMDYIPGDDLGSLIEKQGCFALDQVLHWADQLGSALAYMHAQNPPVIHRDIKPQNIKLTPENDVVLVDFGIAKAADSSQATATGALGFTPGYAPPEQYGSSRTGPYSDQYAFAATLFTLLSGIKPVDSVQRVLGQATLTPLNQLLPTIPPHVQAAIERAMSIRPEDRFGSIQDFLHALNDATAASPTRLASQVAPSGIEATVPSSAAFPHKPLARSSSAGAGGPPASGGDVVAPRRRISGWVWALIVGVVLFGGIILVAGAAGFLFFTNNRQATGQTATVVAIAQEVPSATRTAVAATLTPVATRTQVFTKTPLPPTAIVAAVASATATEAATATLTPAGVDGGGVIAFASDRADGKTLQIWTMKPYLDNSGKFIAGNFTQITSDPGDKTQPAWSPDGKKLLYVAAGSTKAQGLDIWMLDLSTPGSQPVDLTNNRPGKFTDPAWSPDGKLIAFTGDNREDGIIQLYMMNADGSNFHRISTLLEEYSPTWQPDMQWLVYVVNASDNKYLYRRFTDTGFSYMTSTPSAYDSAEIFGRFGQVEQPKISPDGTSLAYVQIKGSSLYVFTADYKKRGAQFSQLTTTGKDQTPAWSADSQMLVFTSERDGNSEIYIMTAGGLLQTNLTNNPGKDMQPAWQP